MTPGRDGVGDVADWPVVAEEEMVRGAEAGEL